MLKIAIYIAVKFDDGKLPVFFAGILLLMNADGVKYSAQKPEDML